MEEQNKAAMEKKIAEALEELGLRVHEIKTNRFAGKDNNFDFARYEIIATTKV